MEEDKFLTFLQRIHAPAFVIARVTIVKFIIVGGMASVVHLATLALLTEWAHVWYLIATTVGFGAGFGVSFTLQKYWTFQEKTKARLPLQAFAFFILQVMNLVLNGALMYVLVDVLGVHYLISQIVVLGVLAVTTFSISKLFIFNRT